MLQKIYYFMVTILMHLRHPRSLNMTGIQKIRLDTEIRIHDGGRILLGKRVTAFKRVTLSANGGILSIGDHTFFNRNCIVVSRDSIHIGEQCLFGPGVMIYDHDHRINEEGYESGRYNTGPVVIGNHCWIGANVTILRGTRIGEGCVIGAGTVVKGEIPAHSKVTFNRELIVDPLVKTMTASGG